MQLRALNCTQYNTFSLAIIKIGTIYKKGER